MRQVDVYILSDEDCKEIIKINKTKPRGPQIIICDHGNGPCIELTAYNDPIYAEWKNILDTIGPNNRMKVKVTIKDDFDDNNDQVDQN